MIGENPFRKVAIVSQSIVLDAHDGTINFYEACVLSPKRIVLNEVVSEAEARFRHIRFDIY